MTEQEFDETEWRSNTHIICGKVLYRVAGIDFENRQIETMLGSMKECSTFRVATKREISNPNGPIQ